MIMTADQMKIWLIGLVASACFSCPADVFVMAPTPSNMTSATYYPFLIGQGSTYPGNTDEVSRVWATNVTAASATGIDWQSRKGRPIFASTAYIGGCEEPIIVWSGRVDNDGAN